MVPQGGLKPPMNRIALILVVDAIVSQGLCVSDQALWVQT
jgi:hypothetical protein